MRHCHFKLGSFQIPSTLCKILFVKYQIKHVSTDLESVTNYGMVQKNAAPFDCCVSVHTFIGWVLVSIIIAAPLLGHYAHNNNNNNNSSCENTHSEPPSVWSVESLVAVMLIFLLQGEQLNYGWMGTSSKCSETSSCRATKRSSKVELLRASGEER